MDEEGDPDRYRRQRWEHATGAARVALDSLREIWPAERLALPESDRETLSYAAHLAEDLVVALDKLSQTMLGDAMVAVLAGEITTEDEFERQLRLPTPFAGDYAYTTTRVEPAAPRNKAHEILTFVCEHPGKFPPETNGPEATLERLADDGWVELRQFGIGEAARPYPTPKALDAFPEFTDLSEEPS